MKADSTQSLKSVIGADLPPGHYEWLRRSNGDAVCGGYHRLFGILNPDHIDLVEWNRKETWKFSWEEIPLEELICFGETAFGHQYAYSLQDLAECPQKAPVYEVDAFTMKKRALADNFEEFMKLEYERVRVSSYDSMIEAVRLRFGDLTPVTNLVFVPSLLLGGTEDLNNVVTMPAVAAMIANGDLRTQLVNADEGQMVKGLEAYQDELGRPRLRVNFA